MAKQEVRASHGGGVRATVAIASSYECMSDSGRALRAFRGQQWVLRSIWEGESGSVRAVRAWVTEVTRPREGLLRNEPDFAKASSGRPGAGW